MAMVEVLVETFDHGWWRAYAETLAWMDAYYWINRPFHAGHISRRVQRYKGIHRFVLVRASSRTKGPTLPGHPFTQKAYRLALRNENLIRTGLPLNAERSLPPSHSSGTSR